MNEIHGIKLQLESDHPIPEEQVKALEQTIDRLYQETKAIFDKGLIARLERFSIVFDEQVIKFLDCWCPDKDGMDLVALNGIRASTLYVCPVYRYTVTGVTREEMERELGL